MFAILLIGLAAGCVAAPHYPGVGHFHNEYPHYHHHEYPHYRPWHSYNPFMGADVPLFDTEHFMSGLANSMRILDETLNDLHKRLPATMVQQERIQGNKYQITIPLSGFDAKEVVVKARDGVLMVQAVHKIEGRADKSYLNIKTLSRCVDVSAGLWVLENNMLVITFPLKNSVVDGEVVPQVPISNAPVTEDPVTNNPVPEPVTDNQNRSREEMDTDAVNEKTTVDADVGLRKYHPHVDQNDDVDEVSSNGIEATTYAVDYENEIDFVPVKY